MIVNGTRDTIQSVTGLTSKDIRLTMRLQKETTLPPIDEWFEIVVGNLQTVTDLYAASA